jgi:hypothetical protein
METWKLTKQPFTGAAQLKKVRNSGPGSTFGSWPPAAEGCEINIGHWSYGVGNIDSFHSRGHWQSAAESVAVLRNNTELLASYIASRETPR